MIGAEIVIAARNRTLRRGVRAALLGCSCGIGGSAFISRRLLRPLGRGRPITDRYAIIHAEHDDDSIRLLRRQLIFDGARPVERLVFRIVMYETGRGADVAHHAGIRLLLGVDLVESVAEPVGHGIAHHYDGRGWRRFQFARRRRLGIIDRRPIPRAAEEWERKQIPLLRLLVIARIGRPVAPIKNLGNGGLGHHRGARRNHERNDQPSHMPLCHEPLSPE